MTISPRVCFSIIGALSLVACETHSPNRTNGEGDKTAIDTPPVRPEKPIEPFLIPKAKVPGVPEGKLGDLMKFVLPGATAIFVFDAPRLVSSPLVSGSLSSFSSLFGSLTPSLPLAFTKASFDPLRDIEGLVISVRDVGPAGTTPDAVYAFYGKFDAKVLAEALLAMPMPGGYSAEVVAEGVLLVGRGVLLPQAKLEGEKDALIDAPELKGVLAKVDDQAPLFGAVITSAADRAKATTSSAKIETASFSLDLSHGIDLKTLLHYPDAPTTVDAKADLEKSLKEITPALSMFGVTDTEAFFHGMSLIPTGAELAFNWTIDQPTSTSMVAKMVGLFGMGLGMSSTPTPPPVYPASPAKPMP